MSRYSLKPLPHRADVFEVAVGWDPGLNTYFTIVFGTLDANADPVVLQWRGSTACEIIHAAETIGIASCYADIPDNLEHQLEFDRLKPGNPPEIC